MSRSHEGGWCCSALSVLHATATCLPSERYGGGCCHGKAKHIENQSVHMRRSVARGARHGEGRRYIQNADVFSVHQERRKGN